MDLRIGCSGWSYRHWKDDFYPAGLAASRWLEYYATQFDTTELNTTFYRLPPATSVAAWRRRTPEGFCFAVKASRYITHMHRLDGVGLDRFQERIAPLADRTGPFLYQLPPAFQRDDSRLERFLAQLPRDACHAFEFRHESWWDEAVAAILRRHAAIFVLFNMGATSTPILRTATETYVRLHGPEAEYASAYPDASLRRWIETIRGMGVERAWVYFNNDLGGHAPRDAMRMKAMGR